jgi:hypothetical protein
MQKLQAYRHTDPVPSSAVVWRGRSAFDHSPIVAIVTGLQTKSRNVKTGANLAQLWILAEDISPLDAIRTGRDRSICGICRHRGDGTGKGRSCYVSVKNAPRAVWTAYSKGAYLSMRPADVATHLVSRGMGIRIGAYGDGAALPIEVLEALTHGIYHTGYTHAWRTRGDLAPLLMASADSAQDQVDASTAGWRTFRVRTATEALAPKEIACPASEEAGKRTSCDSCGLCNGARTDDRRANIAIIVHGIGTSSFLKMAVA